MFRTAALSEIGGRENNEDSLTVLQTGNAVCALVADGLGGYGGGEIASQLVKNAVEAAWKGEVSTDSLQKMLLDAHEAILWYQTPDKVMKSTAVVMTANKNTCCWAHVGDSRLYHFVNGRLHFQTKDHSISQTAVSMGQITAAQIRSHPDRNRLFRALGQESPLKIETGTARLSRGQHAWLLCSDGFWEYVVEDEMQHLLALSSSPDEWLERMNGVIRQNAPDDRDNCSAAAVWLNA